MQTTDLQQALERLIAITRWANRQGLTPGTGGNFSLRHDSHSCWVTASGVDKGALTPSDFIRVGWDHTLLEGRGTPSAETGIHTTLYELDPNIVTVCHTHALSATVLSRLTESDWFNITGWEMQKTQPGITTHESTVSLALFDNHQDMTVLAEQIKQRWTTQTLTSGILVRGHGLYSWSYDMNQAQMNLEGLIFLLECELTKRQLERE